VSNSTAPLAGAVHWYHTDAPPGLSPMVGSPDSNVAPTLVPTTEPEAPLTCCVLAKSSLGGGGPDGAWGVIAAVGCDGWLVPPSALVAVTVNV
jgi:hypothetical protein